jgi:hypothetical protein
MSVCKKAVGIQRPSFQEMNEVGARALASVLLPSRRHPWSAPKHPIKKSSNANGIDLVKKLRLICKEEFHIHGQLWT